MNKPLNLLILSCGTRNKIIQYFKSELSGRGKVMAADCSPLAPALYEADVHFIVPQVSNEDYIESILKICQENKVSAILTLIDSEISLLAKNKDRFLQIGSIPIVSEYNLVEACLDKIKFNHLMEAKGFRTIKSYTDLDSLLCDQKKGLINYPLFVKPIQGSASINISKVDSPAELKVLFSKHENLMIQEFMSGEEIGIDAYIDMISGRLTAVFIKKKIKMRAGETDKSVSIKDPALLNLIEKFIERMGFRGIIDIDVFKIGNHYYISEVNPRFGGGYPHAHACGINIPKMIVKNIYGVENVDLLTDYAEDVYMMKYNDIMIM